MENILLALGSGSMWGMSAVLEKNYLVEKFNPLQIITYRSLIIATFFMLFLLNKKSIAHISNLNKSEIFYFILAMSCGLCGIYLFFTLMKKSGSTMTVSMVQPLVVVFATIFSVCIFNEKLKKYDLLGIFLVICGILLLNWDKISKFFV